MILHSALAALSAAILALFPLHCPALCLLQCAVFCIYACFCRLAFNLRPEKGKREYCITILQKRALQSILESFFCKVLFSLNFFITNRSHY